MLLTVLVDNVAGADLGAEHGLSYLIEHKGKHILFDTGHSSLFKDNATKLGIDLQATVNYVVLSHGHWDHGNGLEYLSSKTLVTHPDVFIKRYRKDGGYIGIAMSETQVRGQYDVHTHNKPFLIDEGLIYLGEIPRLNDFESKTTSFFKADNVPDFVMDDSALVIMEKGALNIITGCSHAGICNIIEYAKNVTHCNIINSVIGGFHLKHNNKQTKETIAYFKQNDIKHIYPSHCTGFDALSAFHNALGIEQLKTGMIINV
jgi:7,8-dihydropterin-6-yl-methyl-4-(beta-D-ribofuranosyl)aminobenzene 5'-phosphate synthase